jgi:hypothetical protein
VDTIAVGEDLHLVLPIEQPIHYGNHSCDPNLWWDDAYTLVARRAIGVGEEVTSDYATSPGVAGFALDCACRSSLCRAVITGEDWRRPELQARYGDHWIPMLLARIRTERRCSRCSLIVRRLQGLLASNPGDALRAPSGIWRQPILRVPSIQQRD